MSSMAELRQCAWCWLVMDQTGAYSVQALAKLQSATHGICPTCKAAMLAEINCLPAAAVSAEIDRRSPALLAA